MSDSNTPRSATDANLLFGVLALQMGFITQDSLITAIQAWIGAKRKPLGEILVVQGDLSPENRTLLEALVLRHQAAHNHDLETSLAAATASFTVPRDLWSIDDDDLRSSLASASTRALNGQNHNGSGLRTASVSGQRYRILRPFARGGLGEVSIAEDLELHREVALKEIQAQHAHNEDSRSRFLLEAEITGRLEHPGIVPVYGLGTYDDGRPYYAMRLIRGDTLKKAIQQFHAPAEGRTNAERNLRLRDLLGRFIGVCNAVAYAHSRGILHRDLKPGNIMLGPFGETLVVDWGLSKPVERPERFRTSDEAALRPSSGSGIGGTIVGTAIGTPGFMSPEQAEGRLDELGPASDVYSLGATLYALLTSKTPFQDSAGNRAISSHDPAELKRPRELRPDTPRALEAICLKAMAREPGDRYASALDLAAEIEHWLADEPVQALREPLATRAARWGRRHRTALVAASVFLLSAVAALSISTALVWAEQRKTAAAKVIAEENYKTARQQNFDIIRMIETSEPELASVPALHERRRELLGAASEACRKFREQDPDDIDLQKRTAQIFRFHGNFLRLTNDIARAEQLYRDSIAIRERIVKSSPDDTIQHLLLGDTFRDLGSLQVKMGQLPNAIESFSKGIEIASQRKADDQDPLYRRRVGLGLLNLAIIEHRQLKHENGGRTDSIRKCVEHFKGLVEGPPEQRQAYDAALLAAALNMAAMMDRDVGKTEAAAEAHKEAIALLQGLPKKSKQVNDADLTFFEAACRIEQSKTWVRAAKANSLSNAETNLTAALFNLGLLAKDFKSIPIYREAIAVAYNERGRVRIARALAAGNADADAEKVRAGFLKEARTDFEKARDVNTALLRHSAELPELHWELARAHSGLSLVAAQLNDQNVADHSANAETERQTSIRLAPEDKHYRQKTDETADK